MSGHSALDRFISGVERLGRMNAEVAKAAEKGVLEGMRETVDAAQAPDGSSWPERAEGGKALSGAGDAIKSSVKGNSIALTIGKPYVFHQHGAVGHSQSKDAVRARKATAARQASTGKRSKFHAPRRQILPEAGEPIPVAINEAIASAARKVFEKATGT